jgi:hypothetical protein
MMRKHISVFFSITMMLVGLGQAHATLIGDEITGFLQFDGFEGDNWLNFPEDTNPTLATVGAGVEFTTGVDRPDFNGLFTADFDDNSLWLSINNLAFAGAQGHDYWFEDLDWLDAAGNIIDGIITDVILTSSDFALSVDFTDHSIHVRVDRQDLPSTVGNTAHFDIVAVHVPEPTALALLSLGLAVLSFTRRRMKT